MDVVVAQAFVGNAIHRRRGDDTAEGARHAETGIVRHDQQDIRGALRRDDPGAHHGFDCSASLVIRTAEALGRAAEAVCHRWSSSRSASRVHLSPAEPTPRRN